jgi:hypothetical protein
MIARKSAETCRSVKLEQKLFLKLCCSEHIINLIYEMGCEVEKTLAVETTIWEGSRVKGTTSVTDYVK